MVAPGEPIGCPLDGLWPMSAPVETTWPDRVRQLLDAVQSGAVEPQEAANLAAEAVLLGYPDRAVDLFEALLARGIEDPNLLNNLGFAWLMLGRPAEALDYLERIGPEQVATQAVTRNRLVALLLARQEKQVVQAADELLALKPASPDAHFLSAFACERVGQLDKAMLAYDKTVKLDATRVDADFRLGLCALELGRNEQALCAFSSVGRHAVTCGDADFYMGLALLRLGEAGQARLYFEALHKRNWPDPSQPILPAQPGENRDSQAGL